MPLTKLKETALIAGLASVTPEDVDRELKIRSDVIKQSLNRRTYVTTKAVLDEEKYIIDFAKNSIGAENPLNETYELEPVYNNETDRFITLNDNQNKRFAMCSAAVTGSLLLKESRHRKIHLSGFRSKCTRYKRRYGSPQHKGISRSPSERWESL